MQNLPWPTKQQSDNFINATLDTIGRTVIFDYVESVSGCSACSLDPVSNTSTDAFCVVCSGIYWMEFIKPYSTKAHITWRNSEELSWYSAGTQPLGDCQVRVNYTDELNTILETTKHIEVDGRIMQIRKKSLKGSPEVNRIILTLMEKEK